MSQDPAAHRMGSGWANGSQTSANDIGGEACQSSTKRKLSQWEWYGNDQIRGIQNTLCWNPTTKRTATYGLPSIDGIMYVSQNTNLFNRSIYENIIYPMDDANLEEVYELINIFGLNSLITSENDLFQKKPGDFGNKFSGGEKQKILIIRTLINRPHIILFDEITSSLDSNSTKVFYEMLNTRLSSSTVLFVSHDDVVDSAFDRVLEIDELHAL